MQSAEQPPSRQTTRTVSARIKDPILLAIEEAVLAEDTNESKWLNIAAEQRLVRDGRLPESKAEADLLSLLREAITAKIDVQKLLESEMDRTLQTAEKIGIEKTREALADAAAETLQTAAAQ